MAEAGRWRRRAGAVLLAAGMLAYTWGPYLVPRSPSENLKLGGRLKVYETSPRPGADTIGAVVLNQSGQRLWADGNTLKLREERTGTLGEVLGALQEPWKYLLYEVYDREGGLMGRLLVHEELIDSFVIDEGARSIFIGREHAGGED